MTETSPPKINLARSAFIGSLLTAAAAFLTTGIEGASFRALGYMPFIPLSACLFGIFLGAYRTRNAGQALGSAACILILAVVFSLSPGGDLALVADGSTYFSDLHFLHPTILHETIGTLCVLALLQLNVLLFQSLGSSLFLSCRLSRETLIPCFGAAIIAAGVSGCITTVINPPEHSSIGEKIAKFAVPAAGRTSFINNRADLDRLTGKLYDTIVIVIVPARSAISQWTPLRSEDRLLGIADINKIKDHLTDTGRLVLVTNVPRSWFFLRAVYDVGNLFGTIDGAATTTDGEDFVVASRGNPLDFHNYVEGKPGIAAVVDRSVLIARAAGSIAQTPNWPFSFLQLNVIPLPYLWSAYLLGAIIFFNGGGVAYGRTSLSRNRCRAFLSGLILGLLVLWYCSHLWLSLPAPDLICGLGPAAGLSIAAAGAFAGKQIRVPGAIILLLLASVVSGLALSSPPIQLSVGASVLFLAGWNAREEVNAIDTGRPLVLCGFAISFVCLLLTFITGLSGLLWICVLGSAVALCLRGRQSKPAVEATA